ncbi:MAG: thiosulfate oxidation carrier complex protein SoxZ [Granulosicoccus sp.]
MSDIRLKARYRNGITELTLRIDHPMESGLRSDRSGTAIPALYIKSIDVLHGNVALATLTLSSQVSRNPTIVLQLNSPVLGDRVSVKWLDNLGESNTRITTVKG